MNDYKELIEQLEKMGQAAAAALSELTNQLAEKDNDIKVLQYNLKIAEGNLKTQRVRTSKAIAELKAVERERDAAVEDMKCNTKCFVCARLPADGNMSHCPFYNHCGLAYLDFEWRGPQMEV